MFPLHSAADEDEDATLSNSPLRKGGRLHKWKGNAQDGGMEVEDEDENNEQR